MRTLRVQIEFDNADGKLFAGEYGQVRLPVTPQQSVAIIPSSALIFNAAGTEVATLDGDDKVHIKNISVGRDLGTELEVTKGLTNDDRVVSIQPSKPPKARKSPLNRHRMNPSLSPHRNQPQSPPWLMRIRETWLPATRRSSIGPLAHKVDRLHVRLYDS